MMLQRMLREPKQSLLALADLGLPVMGGALLLFLALAVGVAAWRMDTQARQLSSEAAAATSNSREGGASRQFSRASEAEFVVPPDSTHLNDLQLLLKIAKDRGVGIGNVEYRQEYDALLMVVVRTLDIRIHEDYPRLKAFMAAVLDAMPHATLREVRVERRNSTTVQGQIVVRLALVYRRAQDNLPADAIRLK